MKKGDFPYPYVHKPICLFFEKEKTVENGKRREIQMAGYTFNIITISL